MQWQILGYQSIYDSVAKVTRYCSMEDESSDFRRFFGNMQQISLS